MFDKNTAIWAFRLQSNISSMWDATLEKCQLITHISYIQNIISEFLLQNNDDQ